MKVDLKTALLILNDMQEHITDEYSTLNGCNGMSEELSEAIDSLVEITKEITDQTSDLVYTKDD